MSYWTRPELEKALKKIISNKNIDVESETTIAHLVPIIKKNPRELQTNIGKLYSYIEDYNNKSEKQKNILDKEIEDAYIDIKVSLYSGPL